MSLLSNSISEVFSKFIFLFCAIPNWSSCQQEISLKNIFVAKDCFRNYHMLQVCGTVRNFCKMFFLAASCYRWYVVVSSSFPIMYCTVLAGATRPAKFLATPPSCTLLAKGQIISSTSLPPFSARSNGANECVPFQYIARPSPTLI